ncbi:MAG TPA: hypothetical protein VEB63_07895 [Chitinophagaceae bacterium]|nr:hypothetical protein [Chitinophagaceae bacterium]
MKKTIFFIISFALLIVWLVGMFVFAAGGVIHSLAMFSAIAYLQALIITPRPKPDNQ